MAVPAAGKKWDLGAHSSELRRAGESAAALIPRASFPWACRATTSKPSPRAPRMCAWAPRSSANARFDRRARTRFIAPYCDSGRFKELQGALDTSRNAPGILTNVSVWLSGSS